MRHFLKSVLAATSLGPNTAPHALPDHSDPGLQVTPRSLLADSLEKPGPTSYPSDDVVETILGAVRGAAAVEMRALQQIVGLPREDLVSGLAALDIEGKGRIVDGGAVRSRRLLNHAARWLKRAASVRARPMAWVLITPRGARFLRSLELFENSSEAPRGPIRSTAPATRGSRTGGPASSGPTLDPKEATT